MRLVNIAVGLIYAAFGVYLWGNSVELLNQYSVHYGAGYAAMTCSVFALHMYFRLRPIPYTGLFLSAALTFVFFVFKMIVIEYLLWAFVGALLASAVFYLMRLIREKSGKTHLLRLTLVIFGISYGIIMLFYPEIAHGTLVKAISVFVVMNGISYLVNYKVEKLDPVSAEKGASPEQIEEAIIVVEENPIGDEGKKTEQ